MKSLQLSVSVRVSVLLYSLLAVAVVAGSGDADVGKCCVVHSHTCQSAVDTPQGTSPIS